MNFHIFVFVSTVIYYIVMKMYKISIEKQLKNRNKSSNLIFVLFVPALLYLTHFMYFTIKLNISKANSYSDDLLTAPYPESNNSI